MIDSIEKWSMKYADEILCNSNYSQQNIVNLYGKSFSKKLKVVYPTVVIDDHKYKQILDCELISNDTQVKKYFVSLNRFERRKNLKLALYSFKIFLRKNSERKDDFILYMAGGYNSNNLENRLCVEELKNLCNELEISDKVEFVMNFTDQEKVVLIKNAIC